MRLAVAVKGAANASRHVLPGDLPAAISYLDDRELEQLQTAAAAELQRRGKIVPDFEKITKKRVEAATVTLTPGKLNAVRAAFKASGMVIYCPISKTSIICLMPSELPIEEFRTAFLFLRSRRQL